MTKPIEVWVSPVGTKDAVGTREDPVRELRDAIRLLRKKRQASGGGVDAAITLREGTYFLSRPLVIEPRNSGVIVMDDKGRWKHFRANWP